jgi:hypothetical protein
VSPVERRKAERWGLEIYAAANVRTLHPMRGRRRWSWRRFVEGVGAWALLTAIMWALFFLATYEALR